MFEDSKAHNQDLTGLCVDLVESLFECIATQHKLMPVSIRIMLKFRLGLIRHPGNPEKMIADLHKINEQVELGEVKGLADLLVGTWLNNLFRYPVLMVSNMKKQVNPALMWVSRLIFEHMMTLRTMTPEVYS